MEIKDSEYEVRKDKVSQLKKNNENPYKAKFNKTHFADEIGVYPDTHSLRTSEEVLEKPNEDVSVAGRVVAIREHGKVSFVDIKDMNGNVQLCIKEDIVGSESYDFLKSYIDLGDFVGATGEVFITKKETIAICVSKFQLLSKALNSFPKDYFGIEDVELRYRKRYLDLTLNDDSKNIILVRNKVINSLRSWLVERGFVELTTRTLQTHYGGAMARPFTTHHHYLDIPLYLRISNELDLKMAVGGSFERAFEFAVDFRNEGIDSQHLQEFQMLEWYCAYENFETGMDWTEDIISKTALEVIGAKEATVYVDREPKKVSLDPPFKRVKFEELLKKYLNIDSSISKDKLVDMAVEHKIMNEKEAKQKSQATLLDELYKKEIRNKIIEPTFITQHPRSLLPLARPCDDDPNFVESYQLVIGGTEVVKGYSELIDPDIQRKTLQEQASARNEGDEEAMIENEEFLTAMEHGFPPITGFGMGVDRFVALLTGVKNIKETVLFPLVVPKKKGGE